MRRTSVGKYHIRLTLQTLTIGSATVVTNLQMPRCWDTKGLWIPLSERHNYKNIAADFQVVALLGDA